jgi:hypothetical protein
MGKPTFDTGVQDSGIEYRDGHAVRSGARRLAPDLRYQKKEWTSEFIGGFKQTRGTETSQYPEERTSTETPLVVASERGPGQ